MEGRTQQNQMDHYSGNSGDYFFGLFSWCREFTVADSWYWQYPLAWIPRNVGGVSHRIVGWCIRLNSTHTISFPTQTEGIEEPPFALARKAINWQAVTIFKFI